MTVIIKDGRKSVYQGDIDRYLQLTDYSPATTVSFENSKGDTTFDVAIDENGIAPIPNQLLNGEYVGMIRVFVSTAEYTLWEGVIEIRHRQLPGDYILEPTKVTTWEEIKAEMTALEESAGKSAEKAESSESAVSEMETRITAMINALKTFETSATTPTDDTKVLLVEGEEGRYIRYADLKSAILGTLSTLNPEEISKFMALTTEDLQQVENYLSGKGIHADTEMSFPQSDDKILAIRGTEGKYITAENLTNYVKTHDGDASLAAIIDQINANTFKNNYANGDAIMSTFTDGSTVYEYPLIVVDNNRDVVLADGTTAEHRAVLQPQYSTPWDIQFCQYRAFLACPSGLAAGSYSVTFAQAWSKLTTLTWYFTLTHAVPAGGRLNAFRNWVDGQSDLAVRTYGNDGKLLYTDTTLTSTAIDGATDLGTMNYTTRNGDLNAMQEVVYGWNQYEGSCVDQFLSSEKSSTGWWVPQDGWDCESDANKTRNGFLSYLDSNLVNALKTVQVKTYYNNVQGNSGKYTESYRRAFLPSLEEMYIVNQGAGEGSVLPYWQTRSELDSPATWYTSRSQYSVFPVNAHSSANYIWLRSANRYDTCNSWNVSPSGYVGNNYCRYGMRLLPLVIL